MAKYDLPPIGFLRECFSVDPDEGVVRWKTRPRAHFSTEQGWRRWNTKNAGCGGCLDSSGYLVFGVTDGGKSYRIKAHRIAFALYHGNTDFRRVDHENHVRSDNRKANLREATAGQNAANRRGWGRLGLPKGVSPNGARFQATARFAGQKTAYLGTFDTPLEAHAAWAAFAKARHGEFFNPGPATPTIFD